MRFKPPLPKNSMGNMVGYYPVTTLAHEINMGKAVPALIPLLKCTDQWTQVRPMQHGAHSICLLRSYFKKEQLQTLVLQFFKESLLNLSIVKNGKDGHYAVQWRDTEA
ncbi:unnamed protein product [Camellia sinensis]